MNLPVHYRVVDSPYIEGVIDVEVETWFPIRETESGYWVAELRVKQYLDNGWYDEKSLKGRGLFKWVSKTSRKRYCYPDLEDAITSFKARKQSQLNILASRYEYVQSLVSNLHELDRHTGEELLEGIKLVTKVEEPLQLEFDFKEG